jgi:subtilisin family serine protease
MVFAWRISTRVAAVVALACAFLATLPAAPSHADGIRDNQWYLVTLRVGEAHGRATGSGVTVAVVDEGIDVSHPDLGGAIVEPVVVEGVPGSPRIDPNGHGTALAGVIVGQGHGANRGNGVLGIAPAARVLPVVVRPPANAAPGTPIDPDLLAKGIELAVQRGAKVICVGYTVESSDRLRAAVDTAIKADAVVVASDGGRPGETFAPFPAAYEGVLAAVPLTRDGQVAVSSTSGRRLGVGVPGESIMTTNIGGGYRIDGGSAAAGVLAGAVALVRSAYPTLPAEEIVHRITTTAQDNGPRGPDPDFGRGAMDLIPALTQSVPLLRPPAPSPSATPPPSASPSASASPGPVAAPLEPRNAVGWLVVLPLLAVVGLMIGYAIRGERRIPAARP